MSSSLARMIGTFRRDQRGSMLVEMTILTPVLIALSAGVFEFGDLIRRKILIEAGLRDGARYAARCNEALYSSVGLTINCATNAGNVARYGTVTAGTTPRVPGWTGTINVTSYTTPNNVDSGTGLSDYRGFGPTVTTVRVTTDFTYATSLLSFVGINTIAVSMSHEERATRW